MKTLLKKLLVFIAVIFIIQIHRSRRKEKAVSWPAYIKKLLGLEAGNASRRQDIDQLRFLATILVIMVHSMQSGAQTLLSLSGGAKTGLWYVLTASAGLALCCNLLFLMISGALTLTWKEENTASFYWKRFLKIVVPLAAYYLFYLRVFGLLPITIPSLLNAARTILAGPTDIVPHFWLIYVLIGLYIAVPFLRWMFHQLPESSLKTMAVVILSGMAIKTILTFFGLGLGIGSFFFSWEGIFLLGYLFSQPWCEKYQKGFLTAGCFCALAIVFIHCTRSDADLLAANLSILMVLFTLAVFLFFQRCSICSGHNPILRLINRYSYSILLVHWYVLFVLVEERLHISPMMFGGSCFLLGTLLQSAAALAFSLLLAILFDNTVVTLITWALEQMQKAIRAFIKK